MAINPLSGTAIQQAVFKGADKNKTGKLDGAEFAKALGNALNIKPTEAQAAKALKDLDADGSGDIDVSEFEQVNIQAADSLRGKNTANLYQALQTAGIASSNAGANVYAQLLNGSLGGSFNSTGALVGKLVGGAVTSKLI